jgi:hypothetical protein
MAEKQMDPNKVICVCKVSGTEVGRIAATAPNFTSYITELTRQYGHVTVDYVEDADEARVSEMLNRSLSRGY